MPLVEQEIEELRRMFRMLDNGKLTLDQLHGRIAIYSQIEKRAKLIINVNLLALKNRGLFNRIVKSNLVGDMVAIDTGIEYKMEKIQCQIEDGQIIVRQECLDSSGQKKNYEVCRGCEHFSITRRLLLGEE